MLTRFDVFSLREQGCNILEIAAYGEMSIPHVLGLLQCNGGSVQRYVKLPDTEFYAWMQARHGYATWHEVAKKMQCSRASAYRYLTAYRQYERNHVREAA